MEPIATVAALFRYPVKSLGGERLTELVLDARGVRGDRRFGLYDQAGKIGSGKSTRRFVRMDGLLRLQAESAEAGFRIRTADGRLLDGPGHAVDAALSSYVGAPIAVREEAEVPHLDAGPVHLVTDNALAWLGAQLGGGPVEARRFRPNLVLAMRDGSAGLIEEGWLGARLVIGEVELEVSAKTQRCVMVGMVQPELADRPEILRALAAANDSNFGVYARVVRPGTIRAGATVRLQR